MAGANLPPGLVMMCGVFQIPGSDWLQPKVRKIEGTELVSPFFQLVGYTYRQAFSLNLAAKFQNATA